MTKDKTQLLIEKKAAAYDLHKQLNTHLGAARELAQSLQKSLAKLEDEIAELEKAKEPEDN